MTRFEDRIIQRFRDGQLVETETVQAPYDDARRQALADYRTATQTLLAGTASVAVKDWVRALNNVLKYLDSEV